MNKTFRVLTLLLFVVMYFTPLSYSQMQNPKQKHPINSSQAKVKFIQLEKLKAKKKRLESEIKKLAAQIKLYQQILHNIIKELQELTDALTELRESIVKEAQILAKLQAQKKNVASEAEYSRIMREIEIQKQKIMILTERADLLRERIKQKWKQRSFYQKKITVLSIQLKIKRKELEKVIAEINKLEGRQSPVKKRGQVTG